MKPHRPTAPPRPTGRSQNRPAAGARSSVEGGGLAERLGVANQQQDAPKAPPVAGGVQGRRLPGQPSNHQAPVAPVAAPVSNLPPGASPFAHYVPQSDDMDGDVDGARANSSRVVAIVGGLIFMLIAGGSASFVVLLVGALWATGGDLRKVADIGEEDPEHILDTGGGVVVPDKPKYTGGGGGTKEEEPVVDEGPKPGPVSVSVPADGLFLSMEVNCPGGFRARSKIRGNRGTVSNVPPGVNCTATFQGSAPLKTTVYAHGSYSCVSIQPVVCNKTN